MLARLPLVILSVITTVRFGLCETTVNSTSFNDLVDRFPECSRSCFHDTYSDLMTEYCGDVASSTDLKDAACICRNSQEEDEVDYANDVLDPCLLDKCPNFVDDALTYLNPAVDLFNWCKPAVDEYGTNVSKYLYLRLNDLERIYYLLEYHHCSTRRRLKFQCRKSVDICLCSRPV